jgi:hypothetical protein
MNVTNLWTEVTTVSARLNTLSNQRKIAEIPEIQSLANHLLGLIEQIRQSHAELNIAKGKATFADLVGTTQDFYGTDGNKFKIGDYVFEALQDDNDGYRSSLGDIVPAEGNFPSKAYCRVRVEEVNSGIQMKEADGGAGLFMDSGYALRDLKSGEVLAAFGTDNEDDYYPCFVFWEFTPKK